MLNSFYSEDELKQFPFKSMGKNVRISRKASFYGIEEIEIGNNVRIDDFCILSGNITIGNYVHISAFVALYGGGGIKIDDYSGVSPRSTIFSATDDFSGEYMIGPLVNDNLTHVIRAKVKLEKYVQVGAHCVILPGVTLHEGAVTGAASLVNKNLEPYTINAGVPCKLIKERSRNFLKLLEEM